MHCWNGSEDPAPSASRWNRRLHIYNLLMLVEQLTSNNCQYEQAASSSEKWQSNCLRLLGGSWTDDKIHGNPRCIFHEFNNFHSLEVISQVVSPYMTDETVSVEARRAVFRLGLIAATGDSWFVKIQIGHINWGDVHWIIMGSYGIISADWMATELSQSPKNLKTSQWPQTDVTGCHYIFERRNGTSIVERLYLISSSNEISLTSKSELLFRNFWAEDEKPHCYRCIIGDVSSKHNFRIFPYDSWWPIFAWQVLWNLHIDISHDVWGGEMLRIVDSNLPPLISFTTGLHIWLLYACVI